MAGRGYNPPFMTATLPLGFVRTADGRLRVPELFPDPALVDEFWEEGFFRVPLLDDEALIELGSRFAALTPGDGFHPKLADGASCTYHCTFLDRDHSYRRQADELVRDVFEAPLRSVIPGYQVLTANIYVKPPGEGRFEIHQNWPTIEALDVPTLTAWVPLQPTSFANGTIRMVRGSHHVFPDVSAASADKFFAGFERDLIETYLEPVDVGAGEALVFDDSLLHWSGANLSSQPRVTFQIELIPDGVPAVLWTRALDDPQQFDLWEIDKEFWIEYPFESVLGAPEGLPHVDRRPNPNRPITLAEFADAMRCGPEIRRSLYDLG